MTEKGKRFLEIRQALSRAANSKYFSLKNYADSKDHRAREVFNYHGASTGRWAGRGFQPHNMLRDSYEDIELLIKLIHARDVETIELLYGNLADALAIATRSMIWAIPGYEFFCGDFSAIEGRVLAWLTGETHILNDYVAGKDPYIVAAASILGVPYSEITKKQRQSPGKIAELACGYQGAVGAARQFGADGLTDQATRMIDWLSACPNDCEHIFDTYYPGQKHKKKEFLRLWETTNNCNSDVENFICDMEILRTIVNPWRANRPATVDYWYNVNEAAMGAVRNPGKEIHYGKCHWFFGKKTLYCKLPSGRLLSYYDPAIEVMTQPWGKREEVLTYMGLKTEKGKTTTAWIRLQTYGGKLTENVTQAIARDLLVCAMRAHEKAGFPVIMHCHDEDLCEVPISDNRSLKEFLDIMTSIDPPWAIDLPIEADGWKGIRYKKG